MLLLLVVVSEDRVMPGNKVLRCWREKLGLKYEDRS